MKPVNEMHVAIITYFSAEKRENLLFLLVGVAAIANPCTRHRSD